MDLSNPAPSIRKQTRLLNDRASGADQGSSSGFNHSALSASVKPKRKTSLSLKKERIVVSLDDKTF